ncbi:Tar (HIV-1) RNA binding protein 1 [Chamberlinius hualienensis]
MDAPRLWSPDDHNKVVDILLNRLNKIKSLVTTDEPERIINCFLEEVKPWIDILLYKQTSYQNERNNLSDESFCFNFIKNDLTNIHFTLIKLLSKTCHSNGNGELFRNACLMSVELLKLFGEDLLHQLLNFSTTSIKKINLNELEENRNKEVQFDNNPSWEEDVEDKLCLEHSIELLSHLISIQNEWGLRENVDGECKTFITLLLRALDVVDDRLVIRVLLEVVPKMKTCLSEQEVLIYVWNSCQKISLINSDDVESDLRIWTLLGCISDTLFSDNCLIKSDKSSQLMPIWMNKWFWKFIQRGLLHSVELQRRRALYMIKRGLNWLENNQQQFDYGLNDNTDDIVFTWNSHTANQIIKCFSDVILILETVEEKQVHVIKPLCSIIVKLIDATAVTNGQGYVLHHSWIGIIIHRLLQHDTRSIRKWTLETVCDLDFEKLPLFRRGTEEILLRSILEALNDTALFSTNSIKDDDDEEFIANKLVNLWNSCGIAHSPDGLRFRRMLEIIKRIPWGAVPIMYIFHSMSKISPCMQWTCDDIANLRELLENTIRSHDVFLRSATQCFVVEAFLKLANPEQLSFGDLSTFFGIVSVEECLKRGTHLWNLIISWFRNILVYKPTSRLNKDLAEQFVIENMQNLFRTGQASSLEKYVQYDTRRSLNVVRLLVILFDCGVLNASDCDQRNNLNQILLSPLSTLKTCFSRPYMIPGVVEGSLEFFLQLICQANSVESKDKLNVWITDTLGSLLSDFLPYLKLKLNEADFEDPSNLDCYFRFFYSVVDLHGISVIVHDFVIDLCGTQINFLKKSASRIKQYAAAKCFNLLYILLSRSSIKSEGKLLADEFFEVCLDGDFLISVAPKDNTLSFAEMTHTMNSNQLSSAYLSTLWTCVSIHLQLFHSTNCNAILHQTNSALDIGGILCIQPVFKCLEYLLPKVVADQPDEVYEVIVNSWKMIDNMKLSVNYWMALESFVNVAFQVSLLENDQLSSLLYKYAKMISELSESTHRIILHLFEKTSKGWMKSSNLDSLAKNLDLLMLFLTFGFSHLKDVRILNQAVAYIVQLGQVCATNDILKSNHTTGAEIRSQAIILLLSLKEKDGFSSVLEQLVLKLLEYDQKTSNEKTRHFVNSRIHRLQLRIWQCILFLLPYLTKESVENLIAISFKKLVEESLQPSVRFYIEWVLTRILYDHQERIPDFWESLLKDACHRFGSLTSIFSIMFSLAAVLKGTDQASFMEKSLNTVLPWCMAQHYNTRVYAQILLRRLWEFCKQCEFTDIIKKLGLIESLLTSSVQSKLGGMGVARLLYDDFKFQVFNPVLHFTFEAIFYEVPRIFLVTDEEWIKTKFFEKSYNLHSNFNLEIPFGNEVHSLSSCEPRKWVELVEDNNTAVNELKDVQKKIIPWKTVFPDLEALKDSSTLKRKEHENSHLILVASLIDRTPNLGGLCRTCEIFGVAEYVIGNLKYMDDKQFQTLSVSAEKWVSIKEVKPTQLKTYILEMKTDGYTIVGAEQTANSTKLTNYVFPKKTVIVLGNEKEGIPVDIIQLLDVSVEIPQQGIIRSLNVHVTGAILVWEYTRQQITSSSQISISSPSR